MWEFASINDFDVLSRAKNPNLAIRRSLSVPVLSNPYVFDLKFMESFNAAYSLSPTGANPVRNHSHVLGHYQSSE